MFPAQAHHLRSLLFAVSACLFAACGDATAAEQVSAVASLSRATAGVGETVTLEVKITGARRSGEPPDVSVNGLTVQYLGPQERSVQRIENWQVTSERSITHVYQVVAQRTG